MNKYEIAKELTLAAIENKYITSHVDANDNYKHMNEQIAENIAAFFNKLVEKLNITE